jgi:hypothetical protein
MATYETLKQKKPIPTSEYTSVDGIDEFFAQLDLQKDSSKYDESCKRIIDISKRRVDILNLVINEVYKYLKGGKTITIEKMDKLLKKTNLDKILTPEELEILFIKVLYDHEKKHFYEEISQFQQSATPRTPMGEPGNNNINNLTVVTAGGGGLTDRKDVQELVFKHLVHTIIQKLFETCEDEDLQNIRNKSFFGEEVVLVPKSQKGDPEMGPPLGKKTGGKKRSQKKKKKNSKGKRRKSSRIRRRKNRT